MYIYLGIAGLVGAIAGGLVYLSLVFLNSALQLETPRPEEKRGRTVASFRAQRQANRDQLQNGWR